MAADRLLRVASVIKEEVARIIRRDIAAPHGALPTVTGVTVSPDLRNATVLLSVYPAKAADETLAEIERHIRDIQQALNERLRMRPVPKIRFRLEGSSEAASRIEEILGSLEED